MSRARVVAAHGRRVILETEAGKRIEGLTRGKRSDAVVGDWVIWHATQGGGESQAVVEAIEPRQNLLFRQDTWRSKSFAANLDQVLMMVAVQPQFSETQLARALIAADAAEIPVTLLLNKIDLPEVAWARERLIPYRRLGLAIHEISVVDAPQATLATLQPLLTGKASLLLGASGTGKSSLLNLLIPGTDSRVGALSEALQAGRHTTTHTSWHWRDRDSGTAVLDSPGFQEFGLHHIRPESLAHHMPDFREHVDHCRFSNCMHLQEPGCAVTAAMQSGTVSVHRHRIYRELVEELQRPVW